MRFAGKRTRMLLLNIPWLSGWWWLDCWKQQPTSCMAVLYTHMGSAICLLESFELVGNKKAQNKSWCCAKPIRSWLMFCKTSLRLEWTYLSSMINGPDKKMDSKSGRRHFHGFWLQAMRLIVLRSDASSRDGKILFRKKAWEIGTSTSQWESFDYIKNQLKQGLMREGR